MRRVERQQPLSDGYGLVRIVGFGQQPLDEGPRRAHHALPLAVEPAIELGVDAVQVDEQFAGERSDSVLFGRGWRG